MNTKRTLHKSMMTLAMIVGFLFFSVGCTSTGPTYGQKSSKKSNPLYDPGFGPFDAHGNYVESLADNTPRQLRSPAVRMSTAPTTFPKVAPQSTTPSYIWKPRSKPTYEYKPKAKSKASYRYYTVKKGDTLYGISRRYKVSVASIQKANGIKGSLIRIGQNLKIPN